jgi:hypothetical protein
VFSDLHEVFFCDFLHFLQQWLLSLKDNHLTNRIRQLDRNHVEIMQLPRVNNKFMCTTDLWLDSIVAGFIIEFVVDTAKYYNATKKDFLKGTRGRYIRSLYTSIKILLYKNNVMTMESDK